MAAVTSDLLVIPGLVEANARLAMVAQAADRVVTRLNHPTIDYDAPVPREILRVSVLELRDALAGLEPDELTELGIDRLPAVRRDLWEW